MPLPSAAAHIHRVGVHKKNCARMKRGLRGFVEGSDGRGQSPRMGETGSPTACVLSSAFVECSTSKFPAGPPLTRGGAVSKQAKEFAQLLRDVGRDYHRSILCLQEFTASNGEVVTETAQGHRVFATPPMHGATTSGDCGRSGDPTICDWWLVLCESEELRS